MKIERSTISTTFLGLAIILGVPVIGTASTATQEKQIIGWIETVQILPENFSLSAKMDTGADHSSLNVIDPMEFMKGEEKWIRFSIPLKKDKAVTMERPILRFAKIKRKGRASQKRAVVLLDLCVGTMKQKEVPVNLADRTRFKYPMLIGRSFLKGSAIVDVSLTFTQSPSCPVQ
jgi:hypothetical protein